MLERVARLLGFLVDGGKCEIDENVCPICGDNLVCEMRFVFCCNPKCDYIRILPENEVFYLTWRV